MTTPDDGADTGDRSVPHLPTTSSDEAAPTLPDAPRLPDAPASAALSDAPAIHDAPFVPPSTPPAAPEPATFDARAMVESQKHFDVNPAYGALPPATEAGREAVEELRAQAQRQRRRNRRIGRAAAVALVGAVGVAGWLGFRTYQDQHDREAAERADRAEESGDESIIDVAESAVTALTPLGEQQDTIGGLDELNDTAVAGGGLRGAVDDALEIVGRTEPDNSAVAAGDPFAARTVDFVYRRWGTAAATSPMVEYVVTYDRIADTYLGDIRPDDGTLTITGTNDHHRFAIYPDGVVERVPRSEASLDPAPDITLAMVFREGDILPPEARPFATIVEENIGAEQGDRVTYNIDTTGWRDREPASFLAWVNRWHPHPLDDDRFVHAARREVSAEETDTTALLETTRTETMTQGVERTIPGATVTYIIGESGQVVAAAIIDNTAEFRAEYTLLNAHDEPSELDLGDRSWEPAA